MTLPTISSEHRHPLEFLPWFRRARPNFLRDISYTLMWSGVVALAISLITVPMVRHLSLLQLLWLNSVYSVLIGLSIHATLVSWRLILHRVSRVAALHVYLKRLIQGLLTAIAVIAGFLAGATIMRGLDGEWSGGWRILSVVLAWGALNVAIQLTVQLSVSRRLQSELTLSNERQLRTEAERAFMRAKVQALHAQIEPHFLFNSLANVSGLVQENPAAATRTLNDLSNFLRSTLDATRTEHTTVSKEITLLRAYLGLMQARMGSRLDFTLSAPEALAKVMLPSMLVQPLVENALKHSLDPRLGGGSIRVEFQAAADRLVIAVSDDGPGFSEGWQPGVGISNVRERLATLYGERASLQIDTDGEGWATVRITLPMELEA